VASPSYFSEQGCFDSDYYYPTELGLLKKPAGAIFDWLAARIYKPAKPAARRACPSV